MTYQFNKDAINEKSRRFYTQMNPGLKATRDTLTVTEDDGETSTTFVIFKGKRTPYDHIRDCGDHWTHARADHYDRIDKETLTVTAEAVDA